MSTARTVRMRLPIMGLRTPPAAPGGGVISVNTASERPEKPYHSSTARITTNQPSPTNVAASESPIMIRLRRRRAAYSAFIGSSDPALDAQQHVAGYRKHD